MKVSKQGELRLGTSGYQYEHWRGLFYPEELPKRAWFAWYAAHFDTVEINNTFYRLPSPQTFDAWRAAAPRGFSYAIKLSRYLTHLKHLRQPEAPLSLFLSRATRLGISLGPILVQLPKSWGLDLGRIADYLRIAPASQRWAVEVRQPSWLDPRLYALLERHGAALVIHDALPRHPRPATADWSYLRFHGGRTGRYGPAFLRREAERIADELDAGRDVYAYFNNDLGGHAVRNAMSLRRYLEPYLPDWERPPPSPPRPGPEPRPGL